MKEYHEEVLGLKGADKIEDDKVDAQQSTT